MSDDNETTAQHPVGAASAARAIYDAAFAEAMDSAKQRVNSGNNSFCDKQISTEEFDDKEDHVEGVEPGETSKEDAEQSRGPAETRPSRSRKDNDNGGAAGSGELESASKNSNDNRFERNELFNAIKMCRSRDSDEREEYDMEATNAKLLETWQFTAGNPDPDKADALFESAYKATFEMVAGMLDSIIQDGLKAYRQMEQGARELQVAKETIESKDQELSKLRATDESQRKTISNLLRAVEKGKTNAKETSQLALVEARMRGELMNMTKEKDKTLALQEEVQRKLKLSEDELRQTKAKLTKADQEKVKLERDRRATMLWAKSMDTNMSSDCDFYKRKVTELNSHIQGLSATITEKNSTIDRMRRQVERSMSNNRIANLRAAHTDHHGFKKARRSY